MDVNSKRWFKQWWIRGQLDMLKKKRAYPASFARLPNWREEIDYQIAEKERELEELNY